MLNRIMITTECLADLPAELIKENGIDIIYFDIQTDMGLFRDTVEINSQNVIEYMIDGKKKAHSNAPSANDFKKFFAKRLKEYDEIIHICITTQASESYANASLARAKMGADGNKIHIVDSETLTAGQGLIVLEAVKCRDKGMKAKEIVTHLQEFRKRVSTSFLAYSADYLYYNDKASKNVMKLCKFFNLHPVLSMVDGKMKVSKVYIGNYKKATKKYIKSTIGDVKKIDTSMGILITSGCDVDTIGLVRENIGKRVTFDKLYENQASATISSNCGPSTFGIMFVKKG